MPLKVAKFMYGNIPTGQNKKHNNNNHNRNVTVIYLQCVTARRIYVRNMAIKSAPQTVVQDGYKRTVCDEKDTGL